MGEVVAHLPVVGDDDDGCWAVLEGRGQFVNEGDGQVVGGFIEEQQVGATGEGECKVEASLLPHRQFGDGAAEIGVRQQSEGADRHGLSGGPVRAVLPGLSVVGLACCAPVAGAGFLCDEPDSGCGRDGRVAAVRGELAGEDRQQRGLSGPVRPDDEEPVAGVQRHRDRGLQPAADGDVVGVEQRRAWQRWQRGEAEPQRCFRPRDLVGGEVLDVSVDGPDGRRGPGGALVLAGALRWSPSGLEPVLCGGQVVGQPSLLDKVTVVALLPAGLFGPAAGHVAGVPVAVPAGPPVGGRIQVEDARGHVGQEPAVVADQHHPRGGRPQLLGEEGEPVKVEVVGRLVQEEEVVARTEQAGQTDAVPLTNRQRRQPPRPVIDSAEGCQRDVHVPVGLPRVQGHGRLERCRIRVLRAGTRRPQGLGGSLEGGQRDADRGQLQVDQATDRGLGVDRDLLLCDPDASVPEHLATFRGQRAGQDVQQRRLAAAVLAHDPQACPVVHRERDVGEHRPAATFDVHSGGHELGALTRRQPIHRHRFLFPSTDHRDPGHAGPTTSTQRGARRVRVIRGTADACQLR
jgi:hypothetical protein